MDTFNLKNNNKDVIVHVNQNMVIYWGVRVFIGESLSNKLIIE